MDQDIVAELQDLVCILRGLNHSCNHIHCVHNYMAHTKSLYIENILALILNHQSSQYITENPCNNQNQPHSVNQEDRINQSLHGCIYGQAKLFLHIRFPK